MLVATEALRPPKLRIGRLGNNFTLPRTVPVLQLIVGGLSSLISIGLFTALTGRATIQVVMYSGVLGAVAGVAAVSYSPLRGESLAKWLGLKYRSRKGRTRLIDGKPVRLAVGICYIEPPVKGSIMIRPGAIQIRPGLFDDRGVRVRETRWSAPVPLADTLDAQGYEPTPVFETSQSYGPRISTAERIAAYRAAAADPAVPDDMVPTIPTSRRRTFGRWSQDGDALRRMYLEASLPPQDAPGDQDRNQGQQIDQ